MRPKMLPYGVRGGETCVVVVDAVRDFFEEKGIFAGCYGERDTEPLRNILPTLRLLTKTLVGQCVQILCRSQYCYDQFKVRGLEKLCTTDQGRKSVLPRQLFDSVFDKKDNSILTSPELLAFLEQRRNLTHLVLTGVTTTSCIEKSITDIRKALQHMNVIVPQDVVASRRKRHEDEQKLFEQWGSEQEKRVLVVPSWEDIEFSGDPRAA